MSVIWRKPVLTYAVVSLTASVNSVNFETCFDDWCCRKPYFCQLPDTKYYSSSSISPAASKSSSTMIRISEENATKLLQWKIQCWTELVRQNFIIFMCTLWFSFFSHFMLHRRELIPHDKLLHLTQCYAMFLRILWTAKQWRHTCQCRCELHMFSLCSKLTFVLAIVHRFSLNRKYRNISRYVSATVRNSFEFSPL